MLPAPFDYQRPTSLAEAISLLAQNEDAKVLAGGHSLIPAMKLRLAQPNTIVDIGRIAEMTTHTDGGPAVICDNIPGYPEGFRVLVNSNSEPRRLAITLGLEGRR